MAACTVIFYDIIVSEGTEQKPKSGGSIWPSVGILTVLNLCPFLFYLIVAKNQPNLAKPEIEAKIGTLYLGLDAKKPQV